MAGSSRASYATNVEGNSCSDDNWHNVSVYSFSRFVVSKEEKSPGEAIHSQACPLVNRLVASDVPP